MNQPIPSMKVNRLGAGVFTIENFLTPSECAEFIAESEALGYEEAAIRTEDGDRLYKDARNNDRIIFDKRELASSLYQRARPLLPAEIKGWFLSGFNERFRFYRYEKQQQFVWHQDGTVRLSETEESLLTFMIYLNDEFEGGRHRLRLGGGPACARDGTGISASPSPSRIRGHRRREVRSADGRDVCRQCLTCPASGRPKALALCLRSGRNVKRYKLKNHEYPSP